MTLLLVVAACLAGAGPSPATAQDAPTAEASPDEQQAQVHFRAGRGHFERGRYEQALAEFEAAYELSSEPALLYNLYLTHERLGNLADAVRFLERYLPEAGEDAETLRARLDNLKARLAEAQREEDARVDAEQARQQELERLRRDQEMAPDSEGGGVPAAAIVSFAAGGAGLVTFGVFALLSSMENADLATKCGEDAGAFCSDDDVSTLRTYNLVADIGLGVGVVGVALGLVFLLTAGDDTPTDAVAVTPWVGPTGGGAALRGGF